MSTRIPLGKRKRRTEVATADSSDHTGANEQDINDIFRRAFEAKFKPLPVESEADPSPALRAEPASEEEDTIWSGLSEDEAAVQVVEHTNPDLNTAVLDKSAKRAFMVCHIYKFVEAELTRPSLQNRLLPSRLIPPRRGSNPLAQTRKKLHTWPTIRPFSGYSVSLICSRATHRRGRWDEIAWWPPSFECRN